MASPAYEQDSGYESFASDVTGIADEELQRREIQKKARELRIAERGKQLMEEREKKGWRITYKALLMDYLVLLNQK